MANTHTTLTSLFTDIANKIRLKKGTSASIKADDFPSEIESIQTGITPSGSQTFTENGTYDVTAIAQAIVNVSGGGDAPEIAWGEVTPTNDNKDIVIDFGSEATNDNTFVFVMSNTDVQSPNKVIVASSGLNECLIRSWNGQIGIANAQYTINRTWANGVITFSGQSNNRFINTTYYWFAIAKLPNPASVMMPSGDNIERS